MISTLRHFLVNSWLGRLLAALVFVAFIGLGGTFVGLGGGGMSFFSPSGILKVGHYPVAQRDFVRALRSQASYALQNGLPVAALQDPATRQKLGQDALQMLITSREAAMVAERNGLFITNEMIRQHVFASPEFQNDKGQFDAGKMDDLLRKNHLDHDFVVETARNALLLNAVLLHFGQVARMPQSLIDHLASFYTRQRVIDIFHMDFAEGHAPDQASEAQLERFYQNHLDMFREPEFRHARIVAMTPQSVGQSLEVPDDVLRTLYKERERQYNVPETRSVQVLNFSTQDDAEKAAQIWQGKGVSPSWNDMQKQFPQAIPAELKNARQTDFPDESLSKAVFSAHMPVNKEGSRDGRIVIVGPVKTGAGWSVIGLLAVQSPHQTDFEQIKDSLRKEVQESQAPAIMQARLGKFQEAVAGSTDLERIPADIGAIAASGLLDAHGMTQAGSPAPLPGNEAMRKAIAKQIFAQDDKTFPHVVTMADGSGFAVRVDQILPGRQKSFSEAHTQILLAWQQDQKHRDINQKMTNAYQAARNGALHQAVIQLNKLGNLQEGVAVSLQNPDKDLPPLLQRAVFSLHVGQSAMLESNGGLWVISVKAENDAPKSETVSLAHMMAQQQNQALQNDVVESLYGSYRHEIEPKNFNERLFNATLESVFPSATP